MSICTVAHQTGGLCNPLGGTLNTIDSESFLIQFDLRIGVYIF
jgi:hypothetical protein